MIKFCIPLLPIRLALSPSSVVDKDNVQLELIERFNEATEFVLAFEIGEVSNQT